MSAISSLAVIFDMFLSIASTTLQILMSTSPFEKLLHKSNKETDVRILSLPSLFVSIEAFSDREYSFVEAMPCKMVDCTSMIGPFMSCSGTAKRDCSRYKWLWSFMSYSTCRILDASNHRRVMAKIVRVKRITQKFAWLYPFPPATITIKVYHAKTENWIIPGKLLVQ